MSNQKKSEHAVLGLTKKQRLSIFAAILLIAAVYAVVPQLGVFDTSWTTLLHSDVRYGVIALLCLLISFAAATSIYMLLSARRLRFGSTYLIQVAGAFAGKVLPVGLGSISVNYLYLRKQRHSQSVAATIVAVNNLLGFMGHMLWLCLLLLLGASSLAAVRLTPNLAAVLGGLTATLLVIGLGWYMRKRALKAVRSVGKQLRSYRQQPARLLLALLVSMVLTACNIAILWLSAQALQLPLTVVGAAIALTAGVLAQSATPTPGGLGGVEAGLVGGLVLSGMTADQAIPVTILFRCITFWLPLMLGGIALFAAIRKKLL